MKKRPSDSKLSNLVKRSELESSGSRKRILARFALMGPARHEHIDVHLTSERSQRVAVSRWNDLLAAENADAQRWRVGDDE